MGLFDNILRKATKMVSNTIEDKVLDNLKNTIEDTFNTNGGSNREGDRNSSASTNNFQNYTIPEKYNEFPTYPGNMIEKPFERETNRYTRITIRYSGSPNSEFISTLTQNEFIKATSVRYDKGNTYVIVDDLGNKTEIVYHIKK